jgi:hypothetical protein
MQHRLAPPRPEPARIRQRLNVALLVVLVLLLAGACSSGHAKAVRPTTTTSKVQSHVSAPSWLDAGAPLPSADIVAWRSDGRLVVLDPRTGHERELTRLKSDSPGSGPSGVTLSVDRRLAFVSWSKDEGACPRLGAIRTDGHGKLQPIGAGTAPRVSADGRFLAYFRAAGTNVCSDQSVAVVDLHDGTQRNITIRHPPAMYSYGGGPWWMADSRHLIAPIINPSITGLLTLRRLDVTTATGITDGVRIKVLCGVRIASAHYPIGVTRDDHMVLADTTDNARSLTSCDLHTGKSRSLGTFPARPNPYVWSASGPGLIFVDDKGVLWRWDGTQDPPARIATGPYQSAAA